MTVQIMRRYGQPDWAVMPYAEYEALVEAVVLRDWRQGGSSMASCWERRGGAAVVGRSGAIGDIEQPKLLTESAMPGTPAFTTSNRSATAVAVSHRVLTRPREGNDSFWVLPCLSSRQAVQNLDRRACIVYQRDADGAGLVRWGAANRACSPNCSQMSAPGWSANHCAWRWVFQGISTGSGASATSTSRYLVRRAKSAGVAGCRLPPVVSKTYHCCVPVLPSDQDISALHLHIVTGSSECTAEFVFVTSLELPDFEVRLRAAQPEDGVVTLVLAT